MDNNNDNLVRISVVSGVEIFFNKGSERFEASPRDMRLTAGTLSEMMKKVERSLEVKAKRVRPDFPIRVITDGKVVEARFRGADLNKNVWIIADQDDKRILGVNGTTAYSTRVVRTGVDNQAVTATLTTIQRLADQLRAAERLLDEQTRRVADVFPCSRLAWTELDEVAELEQSAVQSLKKLV